MGEPQMKDGGLDRVVDQLVPYLEEHLDFRRWGLELSRPSASGWKVFYNSDRFRVRFQYAREMIVAYSGDPVGTLPDYESLLIDHGRVHAPDDGECYTEGERECIAWHHSSSLLSYLDYLNGVVTPEELADREGLSTQTYRGLLGETRGEGSNGIEFNLRLHSRIWERHGPWLFELLDMSRPELWDGYRAFRKSVWLAMKKANEEGGKRRLLFFGDVPTYEV